MFVSDGGGHPAARGEHPAGCLEDVFGLHALSLRHLFTRVSQHMTVPACFEKCCGGGDHEQLEKNTLMCRPCDTPLKSDELTKPSWSFTGMKGWWTSVLRVFAREEVRTLGFHFLETLWSHCCHTVCGGPAPARALDVEWNPTLRGYILSALACLTRGLRENCSCCASCARSDNDSCWCG